MFYYHLYLNFGFLLFLWLHLWFSGIFFGEIFRSFHSTSHPAKHEKSRLCKDSFFDFFKFLSYRCQKTIDFSRKRALTKVKYFLTVCQIFRNITEEKARKFNVSIAFCAHAGVIKYRKTLTFSFERAQITWAFVLGALAIVKLYAIPDINFH